MIPRPKNYEMFRDPIERVLKAAKNPLTWTEIRIRAGFEQKVPNPKWVKWMEEDLGLVRQRTKQGVILWRLG